MFKAVAVKTIIFALLFSAILALPAQAQLGVGIKVPVFFLPGFWEVFGSLKLSPAFMIEAGVPVDFVWNYGLLVLAVDGKYYPIAFQDLLAPKETDRLYIGVGSLIPLASGYTPTFSVLAGLEGRRFLNIPLSGFMEIVVDLNTGDLTPTALLGARYDF